MEWLKKLLERDGWVVAGGMLLEFSNSKYNLYDASNGDEYYSGHDIERALYLMVVYQGPEEN